MKRLVAGLAFAAVVLVPFVSRAANVDTCYHDCQLALDQCIFNDSDQLCGRQAKQCRAACTEKYYPGYNKRK